MTEVVLYHHAQGLTDGIHAFAERLRQAGHTVHVPDLFDGRTFQTLDDGMAHVESVGFGTVIDRGVDAAGTLPSDVVYIGFSLARRPPRTETGSDARRRAWGGIRLFLRSGVGIRGLVASWRPGSDPRHGQRPDLRRRR